MLRESAPRFSGNSDIFSLRKIESVACRRKVPRKSCKTWLVNNDSTVPKQISGLWALFCIWWSTVVHRLTTRSLPIHLRDNVPIQIFFSMMSCVRHWFSIQMPELILARWSFIHSLKADEKCQRAGGLWVRRCEREKEILRKEKTNKNKNNNHNWAWRQRNAPAFRIIFQNKIRYKGLCTD